MTLSIASNTETFFHKYGQPIGVLLVGLLVFAIAFGFALKSDRMMAQEAAWEAGLSQKENARIEYILGKFVRGGEIYPEGFAGMYTIGTVEGESRVVMIARINKNYSNMFVRRNIGGNGNHLITLDKRFASKITGIYFPGQDGHAELAVRFLTQK